MTPEPKTRYPKMSAPAKTAETLKDPVTSDGRPDLSVLWGWFTFAEEAARRKHWEYFVIDQFVKGNHDIRGNPDDNSIEMTKATEKVNFPVNKVFTTFRAVKTFVTRHKPKIEVEPSESTPEAKKYAQRATLTIARDNQLNNGRVLNKELAHYGVKYGIGYRQIGYDPVKKVTQRWTIDPFDLFVVSKTGKFEDAPAVIKSLTRTVGYWKTKFPDANIVPDNEIAASKYKQLAFQSQFPGATAAAQRLEEQTALGYECWYRVFKPNAKGGYVNKCLFTKSEILSFEETPYTEYPFIAYRAEVVPNELYPDGHLKHTIAPQRMFNLLNTQMLEYNHIVNRGRFRVPQGSGFRIIQAKEGQIIMHKPGMPPEVLNPPGVSTLLERQLQMAGDFIEDVGGQHDASFGAMPERATSGRAIENLQLGDSNNISDLRDNFEDALSQEASWILKMYSLFEKEGVVLNDNSNTDKPDTFGVIGKEAVGGNVPEKYYIEDNGSYCDVCAILPDNKVKVSVVSELGETKEARLGLLFKLKEAGLPLKVILNYLEFPNADDVMTRITEEAVADMAMETMKTSAMQPPQPRGPQMPPGEPPETNNADLQAINDMLGQ